MGRIGYHTLTEYTSLELAQTTYKHTNTKKHKQTSTPFKQTLIVELGNVSNYMSLSTLNFPVFQI